MDIFQKLAHLSRHLETVRTQADIGHARPFTELVPLGFVMASEDEFARHGSILAVIRPDCLRNVCKSVFFEKSDQPLIDLADGLRAFEDHPGDELEERGTGFDF